VCQAVEETVETHTVPVVQFPASGPPTHADVWPGPIEGLVPVVQNPAPPVAPTELRVASEQTVEEEQPNPVVPHGAVEVEALEVQIPTWDLGERITIAPQIWNTNKS
jgi:hypothetical protein